MRDPDIKWTSHALGWLSLLAEPGPKLLRHLWRIAVAYGENLRDWNEARRYLKRKLL